MLEMNKVNRIRKNFTTVHEYCFNCCGYRTYWQEYDVTTFRSTTDRIYDDGPIIL